METFFFFASKLIWALVSPDSLLMILAIGAWLAAALGKQAIARRLTSIVALCVLLIGCFPIGEWLIAPLEKRFPANVALPGNTDGIIVLGGALSPTLSSIWKQPELGGGADRLTSFRYLASLYPNAQLVFSGGSGSLTQQQYKEADSAQVLFEQMGISERAILYESESRNTVENVTNTKQLLNPTDTENWILITSAFHMPRSVGVFCQQQWRVTPYPVDHHSRTGQLLRLELNFAGNLGLLTTAMREWVGLIVYRLAGNTEQLLPGTKNFCGATERVS